MNIKKVLLATCMAGVMLLQTTLLGAGQNVQFEHAAITSSHSVRFVFDGQIVNVPIVLGQPINPTQIPVPATRYAEMFIPGEVFMGWFINSELNSQALPHYINNPNRLVAFDLTQPITASMLNANGNLNLQASWLQYGDVNGDGQIDTLDHMLAQAYMMGFIGRNQIIFETADVNGDGRVDTLDVMMIHAHIMSRPSILGPTRP